MSCRCLDYSLRTGGKEGEVLNVLNIQQLRALDPNVAQNGTSPLTLTLSPRFMYQYCLNSAGRGAMPFLVSIVLEPEIMTLAWLDNASVHFPLNIYATKG